MHSYLKLNRHLLPIMIFIFILIYFHLNIVYAQGINEKNVRAKLDGEWIDQDFLDSLKETKSLSKTMQIMWDRWEDVEDPYERLYGLEVFMGLNTDNPLAALNYHEGLEFTLSSGVLISDNKMEFKITSFHHNSKDGVNGQKFIVDLNESKPNNITYVTNSMRYTLAKFNSDEDLFSYCAKMIFNGNYNDDKGNVFVFKKLNLEFAWLPLDVVLVYNPITKKEEEYYYEFSNENNIIKLHQIDYENSDGGYGGKGQLKYTLHKENNTYNDSPIKVFLNNTELTFDQPPIMQNNRVLVPIRAIVEAMGANVEWNTASQTAIITQRLKSIQLRMGMKDITVNGILQPNAFDVPPQIIGDRILVPVRFVSEILGATVEWKAEEQIVYIAY